MAAPTLREGRSGVQPLRRADRRTATSVLSAGPRQATPRSSRAVPPGARRGGGGRLAPGGPLGHISGMPSPIRTHRGPDGSLVHAVALPPERLPAVSPRALLAAWDTARAAADARRWGPPRTLIFRRPDGEATELAIADADAACWAAAVDGLAGLGTLPGLALCLRLLALIEVMTRASWLAGLFDVSIQGIELHPALLQAAATMPLDAGARFDEGSLRRLLSRPLTSRPLPAAGVP